MDAEEKKECVLKGAAHKHGEEVNEDDHILLCANGKWIDKDDLEPRGC